MDQFIIMMNRLWFIITWPSSVLAILFGFWMVLLVPSWLFENWMIAKLGFVFLLIIYHLKTHFHFKRITTQELIKYSSNFMRIWNEVTSVILVSSCIFSSFKKQCKLVEAHNWFDNIYRFFIYSY